MREQNAVDQLVGSRVLSVDLKGTDISVYSIEITTTDGEKITIGNLCDCDMYVEYTDQDGRQPTY